MDSIEPDDDAPTRRKPIQREHQLQLAVRQFARDAIDLPPEKFQFISIDSAQKATDNQRSRMAARGVVAGISDTLLCVANKMPIFVELKYGAGKLSLDQTAFLTKMAALDYGTGVAWSVIEYANILRDEGVALRHQWSLIAWDLDAKVAARIAKLESRAQTPSGRTSKPQPRFLAGKRMTRSMNARRMG